MAPIFADTFVLSIKAVYFDLCFMGICSQWSNLLYTGIYMGTDNISAPNIRKAII